MYLDRSATFSTRKVDLLNIFWQEGCIYTNLIRSDMFVLGRISEAVFDFPESSHETFASRHTEQDPLSVSKLLDLQDGSELVVPDTGYPVHGGEKVLLERVKVATETERRQPGLQAHEIKFFFGCS